MMFSLMKLVIKFLKIELIPLNRGRVQLREACVSGLHVSVVKTHAYWLANMKTYSSFSNRVRFMKRDMEACYSLVFPGPHAFLLVLGDVRNSGKEHYILKALSEVFGQEALDYCKVLFMHEYTDSDIGKNHCVRKCGNRFHILKENEDNVLKLFNDTTGTKQRNANFFTKDLELLDKAETFLKKEFDAEYEERESRLRGDLTEMKTTEENLRTKITEMEKQNSKNGRELQDLRKEVDARKNELHDSRSRENQLSQQIDALKKKNYELKEELYALRYYKRQMNVGLTASNETESQLKSEYEELQRELQLKGSEKKQEKNPRESKDRPKEEILLTKTQLEHNRLQEQKEVQAPAQEEHDRPRTSDRREVELDEGEGKLLIKHHISTAVTPPSVSEDKGKTKYQEDTGSLEGLKLVRKNSMKLDPPDVSEEKVHPLSERECEMERKTFKGEGVKPTRQRSFQDPPNLSEDKDHPQEDIGYLEFERLEPVRENSKKLDPPDGSESDLHMSVL
ncbi:hypothetical protein PO909_007622 [Leuciscus waleckii]